MGIRGDLKGIIQLKVTKDGKPAGSYYATVGPKEVGYTEGEHSKPDFEITIADEDFVSLVSGKIDPMQAFMGGKVKIKGNLAIGMKLSNLAQKDRMKVAKEAFKIMEMEVPPQLSKL